ncbi:glycosyltransferase family 4 protein [Cohnella cholangitidis]|uniref:Glycosyltransferase family 4 protein n=1 Tax=Cohnella cholangitidis TaxID=2598458 RepID=A0A7G5BXM9_9BACL|nr:glycosyltransferase family 4 protein [Cohnella cholangitidis]QMV41713.1 glycosyltransferase family 4 protein [Cohnella cholangitidis]
MKITVICHYFYPEIGAPSARLFEMAKRWVGEGHQVSVVTCFPNHPTGIIPEHYRGKKYMVEEIEGIRVYRNYVYATPNEGFVKKTMGHVSFMLSSIFQSMVHIPKPNVIIVSSPTLFSVISGYVFSIFRRSPFVFEVRDLWPDAIIKLGVLKNKWIIKALESLEMFLYRRSKKVVVVTQSFKKQLCERGVQEAKIEVITNGVDTDIFNKESLPASNELRSEYGWGDRKILLYAGAHGISQGLSTLVEVALRMRDNNDLLFVFVGEGAEKPKVLDLASKYQLTNIQFISSQSKDRIPLFYSEAYLSFVPLRNLPLFDAYIPSKMFEILGSGCPIVGSISGEAEEILRSSRGAILAEPENVDQIEQAVKKLTNDSVLREQLSKEGYEFVKRNFSRAALANKYLDVLTGIEKENLK